MTDNVQIALITLCSSILGGLVAGFFTLRATKNAADREDKRREREIQIKRAEEMMDNLYEPLMKLMTPKPPYHDPPIDEETGKWIIEEVSKNSIYASPNLIRFVGDFREALFNDQKKLIEERLDYRLHQLISGEYGRLKEILGYDAVIKKDSAIMLLYRKLKLKFENKYTEFSLRLFARRVRKRRRKDNRK